jgi:imidazolonepropionase-like amidohydrolase
VPSVTVLVNARVLDCTGREPFEGAVAVEGDRIVDVAPSGRVARPPGATVLDCRGQTLLPGLTDAHVHVLAVEANIVEQHRQLPPSLVALRAGVLLREALGQGYTTVRDCGGADWGLREAVETGVVPGPRLLVAGRPISQTGGHADVRRRTETGPPVEVCVGMPGCVADGPDEVRRAAREELRRGATHLKIMASGGAMSPTDELDTTQYTVAELRAAVEEARAAGTYVAAHAYSGAAVRNAVEAGVRSVEHGNLMDEAAARALRAADAFLVPTMVTYELLAREGARYGVPEPFLRKIRLAREKSVESLALAHRLGLRIASGSDLLGPMQAHRPMELTLKAQVLSPMEVLVSATRTNAELFGLADRIGTVEPGKLADLLVVEGDPLRDLALFQSPDRLRLIMKGGAIVVSRLD